MLNMGIVKTQNFGKIERNLDIESKSDNKAESIKKIRSSGGDVSVQLLLLCRVYGT